MSYVWTNISIMAIYIFPHQLSDLPPVGRVVRSVWKAHWESLLEVRVMHRQDFISQREENEPVQEDDPKKLRRGAPIPIRLW